MTYLQLVESEDITEERQLVEDRNTALQEVKRGQDRLADIEKALARLKEKKAAKAESKEAPIDVLNV